MYRLQGELLKSIMDMSNIKDTIALGKHQDLEEEPCGGRKT